VSVRELIGLAEPRGFAHRDEMKGDTMLVLSRRVGERIFFPSIGAYVKVLAVRSGTVRLSIEAPAEVRVIREELRHTQQLARRVDASSLILPGE
jgi:carbon storage regulator CsrA